MIYFTGMQLSDVPVREFLLLAGSFKMLGFVGGILGIIDLARKRKPREAAAKMQGDRPEAEEGQPPDG